MVDNKQYKDAKYIAEKLKIFDTRTCALSAANELGVHKDQIRSLVASIGSLHRATLQKMNLPC